MEYFDFWIPILKKQYFKYRLTNEFSAIYDLESNIIKNWKLTRKEKREVLKRIRGEI